MLTPHRRKRLLWLLGLVPMLAAANLIPRTNGPTEDWDIAVIQPNLIPWAKQGGATVDELFQAHYQPTLSLDQIPDMVLWPETGLSFNLARYPFYASQIQLLADKWDAAVIVGTLELNEEDMIYNSVWMFLPKTADPVIYRKEKLVWFSESVPWVFSWAKFFDPGMGAFAPGKDNPPFQFRGRTITPVVCFEALMTWYVGKKDTDLIVNLTNDAWFGRTKASAQHLSQVQPRAAEVQAPLVRATNSGISCWVDTNGVIRQPSPLYEQGAFTYRVPVPVGSGPNLSYRIGLFLAGTACLITVLSLSAALRRRVRNGPVAEQPNVMSTV